MIFYLRGAGDGKYSWKLRKIINNQKTSSGQIYTFSNTFCFVGNSAMSSVTKKVNFLNSSFLLFLMWVIKLIFVSTHLGGLKSWSMITLCDTWHSKKNSCHYSLVSGLALFFMKKRFLGHDKTLSYVQRLQFKYKELLSHGVTHKLR